MVPLLYFIGICLIVGVMWVCMKLMPWSGPLAAAAGFGIFVLSVYQTPTDGKMMGFGFGLFCFSALLFTLSNANNNR